MFKKGGGVKTVNVAVFGGGELDAQSLRLHTSAVSAKTEGDEVFGKRAESEYAGLSSQPSSIMSSVSRQSTISFDSLTDEERMLVPEKFLRAIVFIINGLELTESYEAESLLSEVRKNLERDFKRSMAQQAGGTLELAKMRSTMMQSRRKLKSREASTSGRPPEIMGKSISAFRNFNGTFGGVPLHPDDDQSPESQSPEASHLNQNQFEIMAAYGRLVRLDLMSEDDKRFRSPEQKTEDKMVKFFTMWQPFANLAIFVVQMYIMLAVLIRIGFEIPITLDIFILDKFIVDLPMIAKILVSCFALHDDGSGVPKFRPRESATAYLQSPEFFIDLVGTLPLDLVGWAANSRATLLTGREGFVAPQWNLNRLLQCRGMFDSFLAVVEELMLRAGLHPAAARLFHSGLIFLVSVHVVACMVFFSLYSYSESFTSWFKSPALATAPLFDQYIAAYDWSSKNMVGMSRGSTFPAEELQMVAVVFVTAFGVCIYGLLMANLSAYVERSTPESDLEQTIDQVLDTAEYVGMDADLTSEIIKYYEHASLSRHHITDVHEIVEDLPEELAEEIISYVGSSICQSVPLLAGEAENHRFVLAFMEATLPVMLLPDTVIFRRDDAGDSMYIVVSGALVVLSPADDKTPIAELGPGSVVGEIALLADVPRTATVMTNKATYTDCLAIHSEAFQSLLEQFPTSMESIEMKVAERIEELASKKERENRQQRGGGGGAAPAAADASQEDLIPTHDGGLHGDWSPLAVSDKGAEPVSMLDATVKGEALIDDDISASSSQRHENVSRVDVSSAET